MRVAFVPRHIVDPGHMERNRYTTLCSASSQSKDAGLSSKYWQSGGSASAHKRQSGFPSLTNQGLEECAGSSQVKVTDILGALEGKKACA